MSEDRSLLDRAESIRVFAQDAILTTSDRATVGNLMGIRDEVDAIISELRSVSPPPAVVGGELQNAVSIVELHIASMCPDGCLPTPAQERFVRALATITRAALNAAPQPPGGGGWRPIEPAPKDTAVLTYGFGYEVAHFNTALDGWVACWDHRRISRLTHWQPLPPPPGAS